MSRTDQPDSPSADIAGWRREIQRDPSARTPRRELARALRDAGQWNALAEALGDEEAHACASQEERVDVLLELAHVYRVNLLREFDQFRILRRALELAPGNLEVIERMAADCRAAERWEQLIDVLEAKAERLTDPAARLSVYLEIASLCTNECNLPAAATRALASAHALYPDNREIAEQLARQYEVIHEWDHLVELRLRLLRPEAGAAEARTLADIATAKVTDVDLVMAAWEQVLARDPDSDEACRRLEQLYPRRQRWDRLAALTEQMVAREPPGPEKLAHLARLGLLYGERLGDSERSAAAWRAVLDLNPDDRVAFKALSNLYLARRDWDRLAALHDERDRPDQLAALLERVVDDQEPPTRVELRMRIGALHRDRLNKPRQAVRAFQAVIDCIPDHIDAARALLPLLDDGEPALLARVLGILVAQASSGGEQLAHAHRLAEIQEDRLGEPAAAFATRLDVLGHEWRVPAARRELERLAQALGAGERLVAAYQAIYAGAAADPVELQREKASLMLAAARVLEGAGRDDAAVDVLRAVLVLDEADPVPLLLDSLALDAGDAGEQPSARVLGILHTLAEQASGPGRIALLHRVADIEERQGRPAAALEALGQALREDAADAVTLSALERVAAASGDWAQLADVYRAVAGQRLPLEQQIDIRCRLGRLYGDRLGDRERAISTFQRILDLAPRAEEVVDALADQYAAADRWADLVHLLGDRGDDALRDVVARHLPEDQRDPFSVELEVARIRAQAWRP